MITRRKLLKICIGTIALSYTNILKANSIIKKRSRFQIGACDWSIGQHSNIKSIEVGKKIGLDGVQISLGNTKNNMYLRRPEVQDLYKKEAQKHQVKIEGEAIKMTASEFRLLFCLASHPGQVFSREQLLNHTTSEDVAVVDRNIDVHVRSIRKKIGDDRSFIETIRGVGYRFLDF